MPNTMMEACPMGGWMMAAAGVFGLLVLALLLLGVAALVKYLLRSSGKRTDGHE